MRRRGAGRRICGLSSPGCATGGRPKRPELCRPPPSLPRPAMRFARSGTWSRREMSSDASRKAEAAGWIALAALAAALTITPITNNDVFLHLTTGRLVLQTGSVPRVDDYSALANGRAFMAHEWLSGVLFHLIERAFGL